MSDRLFKKEIIDNAYCMNVSNSSCDRISKSWLSKWSEVTGRSADCVCSVWGCGNDAEVGGHLWIRRRSIDYYYIAPICYECNNNKEMHEYYFKMKSNIAYLKTDVNLSIYYKSRSRNKPRLSNETTTLKSKSTRNLFWHLFITMFILISSVLYFNSYS